MIVAALLALAFGILAAPPSAEAQAPAKVFKVGVLHLGTPESGADVMEALKRGMRERGYVEGKHVVYDRRTAEFDAERLAKNAADLVRLKMDVIVTSTDQAIAGLKRLTRTIPIVMANSSDPVGTGFVASLARPGGNVTGNSSMSPELSGKRLALLKEVVPSLSRVAILWNPEIRGALLDYRESENAARALHLKLSSLEVSQVEDLDRAFATMTEARVEALVVPAVSPLLRANRHKIVKLAEQHRLPAMFGTRIFAEAGGLMSYGADSLEQWRRASGYVDKILKGARPADLPVEQPSKFELVVNLKTAKALRLAIPPAITRRADYVIE